MCDDCPIVADGSEFLGLCYLPAFEDGICACAVEQAGALLVIESFNMILLLFASFSHWGEVGGSAKLFLSSFGA
ncbi:hypothetical protein NDU88_006658 [Pleurodeles waltl]|uniref:Uncharacterized protein n=1 Tax=Pleurodeles waltl TaxID=8319 RepID=A0AAV7VMI3_PLEWA|nr:hypothetical protein NDU88_006658 [Pleurodeles waltl]